MTFEPLKPWFGTTIGEEETEPLFPVSIGDSADKVDKAAQALMAEADEDDDAMVAMLGKLAKKRTNTNQPTDNDVKVEPEEDSYWNDLKQHDFYFGTLGSKGNPIAGKWARYLRGDAAAKAAYDQLTGQKAKSDFRANWCKGTYDSYMESKRYREKQTHTDISNGQYFSFGRILVEEGGGKAGRRAAANYALRCMALGGKWFLYDEWTQQLKFAYVVQGFRDTFEQEWVLEKVSAQHEAAVTAGEAAASPSVTAASAGAGQSDAAEPALVEPKANAKSKAKGKADTPTKGQAKSGAKRKDALCQAMLRAKKMKLDYNAATAAATQLQSSIQSDDGWGWARAECIAGDFKRAHADVDKVLKDDSFMRSVLATTDLNELKRAFNAATLEVKLGKMIEMLEPAIAALGRQCKVLLAQHRARNAVDGP